MRRCLIALAGKKYSGKDTAAACLVDCHGFVRYAFADPLKDVCRSLFLFDHAQLHGHLKDVVDPRYGQTPRQLMQKLGTDFVRDQVSPTFWVDRFRSWYATQPPCTNVVVSDVRHQNEVDVIKSLGGCVCCVHRAVPIEPDPHSSEQVQNLQGIDLYIDNDKTIDELHVAVGAIARG